jgi:hypothetical protein
VTKRDKKEITEARVFAALYQLEAANAEEVADEAGDAGTNTFCTPQQATATLKMYEGWGLVEDAGPDPAIKRARRRLKRWQLTSFGKRIAVAVINSNVDMDLPEEMP